MKNVRQFAACSAERVPPIQRNVTGAFQIMCVRGVESAKAVSVPAPRHMMSAIVMLVQSFLLKIVKKYTQPTELTPALLREFVEKIVVHAPDKSSGHRVQRIDVHYNFIGEIDFSPEFSRYSKKTTA